jgi:GPH family glycoside/pentoside/hexuronide:cation symporter
MKISAASFVNRPIFDSKIKSKNVTDKEKWLGYLLGPSGTLLFNALLASYLNVFYTDVLKLGSVKVLGGLSFLVIFPTISQVLSAISNIVVGYFIDRTKTKQGKARPWILFVAPLIAICGILLFIVPQSSTRVQVWWVLISYNLYYSLVCSIYNMSHSLMVPLSTRNGKQRSMLSIFTNIATVAVSGIIVALIFPMVLLPILGANQYAWIEVMSILAILAMPLTLMEYYFTKERVTEESLHVEGEIKVPLKDQIRAVFTDRFWLILMAYQFIFALSTIIKNTSLIYFCNYVLGTYNDGISQTLVAAIGGIPMGIGVILIWPLTKKFGKRNVTMFGFLISSIGGLICLSNPTNYIILIFGQFVKNMGLIPASYVFPALFGDVLDHIEWKKGYRCDGFSASIFSVIITLTGGLGITIFNGLLSITGNYKAPIYDKVTGLTVGFEQSQSVQQVFTFGFLGLEVVTHLILFILLFFFGIEKIMPKIQSDIRERQRIACEKAGNVWVDPEELARREQEAMDAEAEENRVKELKEKCRKKGLKFEEEEEKYQNKLNKKRK